MPSASESSSYNFSPTPDYLVFLDLLRRAREEQGISHQTLALRLRWPLAVVQRCERGEVPLDVPQTRAWLRALGRDLTGFCIELDALLSRKPDGELTQDAPPQNALTVLVFSPGDAPHLRTVPRTLSVLGHLLGTQEDAPLTTFDSGIVGCPGVVARAGGVGDGEEIGLRALTAPTLIVPYNAQPFYGRVLFVGGEVATQNTDVIPSGLRSLSPLEVEQLLDAFAPSLSPDAFSAIIRSHPLSAAWMENWE